MASDSRDRAQQRDVVQWLLTDHAVEVMRHLVRIRTQGGFPPWVPDEWMSHLERAMLGAERRGPVPGELAPRMVELTIAWQRDRKVLRDDCPRLGPGPAPAPKVQCNRAPVVCSASAKPAGCRWPVLLRSRGRHLMSPVCRRQGVERGVARTGLRHDFAFVHQCPHPSYLLACAGNLSAFLVASGRRFQGCIRRRSRSAMNRVCGRCR